MKITPIAWTVTALASLFGLYLAANAAFVSRREWDAQTASRTAQLDRIEGELRDLRVILEAPGRVPTPAPEPAK